jgi:hypothetical protein
MPARITSDLESRVQGLGEEQLVDVVVELRSVDEPPPEGSRLERIHAKKDAFDGVSAEVERAVRAEGGEVVDRAWINQTVRAKVPARAIPRLALRDDISVIDVPHAIEPDQA